MPKSRYLGIDVTDNVKVDVDDANVVHVTGPHGSTSCAFDKAVILNFDSANKKITVDIDDSKLNNIKDKESYRGLYRSLLSNMVFGVSNKFKKELELIGVGYKGNMVNNRTLEIEVGYSHTVMFVLPAEVSCVVSESPAKTVVITLESIDKYLVGQVAAKIIDIRHINPYSGKGIHYLNSVIKRKEVKAAKK